MPADRAGMRYYISGPMTGYPGFNFATFDAVAEALIAIGVQPISPADHDREVLLATHGLSPEDVDGYDDGDAVRYAKTIGAVHDLLGWDFKQIVDADGIVMLPGWQHSTGARHERYVAEACAKPVHIATSVNGRWTIEEEPPIVIVGLTGVARSGKDTVGKALIEHAGFERISFADVLRNVLLGTNPLVPVHISSSNVFPKSGYVDYQRLSRVIDDIGWERAKDEIPEVRQLLQRLGTEGGRTHINETVWVDAALKDVAPGGKYVVTDVRFPNEAQAIRKLGGEVWRITRPGFEPVNAHVSDAGIPDELVAKNIANVGTKRDLRNVVASYFTEA